MRNGITVLRMFTHRYRWVYPAMAIYMAALAGVAHWGAKSIAAPILFTVALPFGVAWIATTAAFANPDSDLASESSGYPPFLLRMPVGTLALALWPMLAGVAWAVLVWLGMANLYLAPLGAKLDIWTAPIAISALVLMTQALLWMPVRSGKVRVAVGIGVPAGIIVATVFMVSSNWGAARIAEVFGAAGVLAAGAAVVAVTRARTLGSVSRRVEEDAKDTEKPRRPMRAFRSPYEAQVWLEWQRQGKVLPVLTASTLALLSLPLLWNHDRYNEWFGGQQVSVNTWVWPMMRMLPWIPLLFATVIGLGARRADLRTDDGVYHLFFATRPLSSGQMLRAKYAAITRGVLVSWGLTLVTGALWLCMTANDDLHSGTTWHFILERVKTRDLQMDAALLGLAVVWTWRNQFVGAFVDYLTHRWVSRVYPLAVVTIGATLVVVLSLDNKSLQRTDIGWMYIGGFGLLVAVKVGLAVVLGRRLVRERASERRFLAAVATYWPQAAALACLTLWWILSELLRDISSKPAIFSTPVVVLVGLLLTPLARPIGARLALETGRHR